MNNHTPLTDKALARLRDLAKGNGVESSSIQLIESQEKAYVVHGKITLTPQSDIGSRQTLGRVKNKGEKIHTSFAELEEEVQTIQKSFQEDATWLQKATKELEKTKGHGWGLDAAHLSWSNKNILLAATENCPACRGSAQHPCPDCRGLGTLYCQYCESRGQELCIQCAGHDPDPHNPSIKCPMCHGTHLTLCRYCHGTGKMPCVSCQGKGHTPCADCRGTGCISRQVLIKQGARADFSLDATSGLPSGLLRIMTRLGNIKLAQGGHANVKMTPIVPEKGKKKIEHAIIKLEAHIPYADIKIKFGNKGALVSCFGNKGSLSGVPFFLDGGLEPAREILTATARNKAFLAGALKARAINDALNLALSGKTHPNDLRRRYPVGMSNGVAQEIMGNITQILKNDTAKMRTSVGALLSLAAIGLFAALFFTPLFIRLMEGLPPFVPLVAKVLVPFVTLTATWFIIASSTRWLLKQKYPKAQISPSQNIGKRGHITLGFIAVTYLLILFFAGQLAL